MKNILFLFIFLAFFIGQPILCQAANTEYLTILYSNDLRGETEPCG